MLKQLARVFARRDKDRFPDDENGDILFGIWKRGGDLDEPRPVDFSLLFPSRSQADAFAETLSSQSGDVEVSYFEAKECWDLRFSPVLAPSWKEISRVESWLGREAQKFSGRNDGWGFFSG